MILFSKTSGQVVSLPDPALPANISLRLENWGGFVNFKSIITRVAVSAHGSYQFLHTLGGQVFIYVFGDRIGDLTLSGLAFDSTCNSPADTLGIERVLNYYAQNRLANRKTPIRVTIGALTTVQGYLLDVSCDVRDTPTRIWDFNLHLGLIPKDTVPTRKPEKAPVEEPVDAAEAEAEPAAGGELETGTFPPLPAEAGRIDTGGGVEAYWDVTPVEDVEGLAEVDSGPRLDLVRSRRL